MFNRKNPEKVLTIFSQSRHNAESLEVPPSYVLWSNPQHEHSIKAHGMHALNYYNSQKKVAHYFDWSTFLAAPMFVSTPKSDILFASRSITLKVLAWKMSKLCKHERDDGKW